MDVADRGEVVATADEPDADVPGVDVPGVDVPGVDVPGADVPGVDVPGADVPGADVPGADEVSNDGAASGEPGLNSRLCAASLIGPGVSDMRRMPFEKFPGQRHPERVAVERRR